MMEIINTIKGNEELLNRYETLYIEDIRVSYKLYHDSIDIIYIDSGMKRGSVCRQTIINKNSNLGYDERKINFMSDIVEKNKECPLEQLLLNPQFIDQTEEINLVVRLLNSKDVYSPFWKPSKNVKIEKRQFTLTDIKKMLNNGQIEECIINKQTSDDYLYDAENNFHKGKKIDNYQLCEDLVKSPSGWRVCLGSSKKYFGNYYINKNDLDDRYFVEIACHYYKYVRCYLKID